MKIIWGIRHRVRVHVASGRDPEREIREIVRKMSSYDSNWMSPRWKEGGALRGEIIVPTPPTPPKLFDWKPKLHTEVREVN